MIYFTADQHFGHENIIKYCGRPFKDRNHMDKVIIDKYNEIVKEDDTIYFLGDLTMFGVSALDRVESIVNRLPGQKHLILGNHDKLKPFQYVDMGFSSVHTALQININGIDITLTHDPVVANVYPGLWLCGHVHSLFKEIKTPTSHIINVGVDIWNFYPAEITQILELTI